MIKVFVVTLMMGLSNGEILATSIPTKSCSDTDVKQAVINEFDRIGPLLDRLEELKIKIDRFDPKCRVIETGSADPLI